MSDRRPTLAAPLLLWMFLQTLALPLPAAVAGMLIIQFIASAMLFPVLLRDVRSNLMMLLGAGIMLAVAVSRTDISIPRCIGAWTCLGIWLTGLTFCSLATLARTRRRMAIIAIANALTAGGLILWYLATEFGGSLAIARYLPLVATLRVVTGDESLLIPLASTLCCAAAGGLALRFSKWSPMGTP